MPSWFPVIASSLLALVPVIIWIEIIHQEGEEKSLYIKTFLLGTLAIIPPFFLIILFDQFPSLNIYARIADSVHAVALAALLTNIIVAVIEETAKNLIVRALDRRHPEYIQTISSALKLSVCAGLGFSFAENIFYFFNIWINPDLHFSDLFATFIFRSVFTMCGHMVFSGIFGYYFGLGKFSADLTEFAHFEGKQLPLVHWVSKMTGKMPFEAARDLKNLKGLFIAMTLHVLFNVSLDLEHKLPSILIVIGSALYIVYLLQTKSGHLLFSITKRKASTMAARDQEVVMELLGMFSKEGRLEEVMQICDRLLTRDPDNNVVKLFKAKAADNKELRQVYESVKAVFEKTAPMGALSGVSAESASAGGGASGSSGAPGAPILNIEDEKVVLEVMGKYYKAGKYQQVLDVANRLLARNPQSSGAQVLLQKAMDRDKLKRVFDSLTMLFKE